MSGTREQVDELNHVGILGDGSEQRVSHVVQLAEAGFSGPGAAAQQLSELCREGCQLEAGVGSAEVGVQIPGVDIAVDFNRLVGVGILPAQLDGGDAASVAGTNWTA